MERAATGTPDTFAYRLRGPLPLARGAIDRAAERRGDPAWLNERWIAPGARVLVVDEGQTAIDADLGALRWASASALPDDAVGSSYLLGVDGDQSYFAVAASIPDVLGPDVATAGLRELGLVLDDREASLATHAIALANWHATHQHCPRCGRPTHVANAGHVRRCEFDQSEHFPRTDPAMIVLVIDEDDRGLLARQTAWPNRRFSTLAGFVEPGESLEQAVVREVREEAGVEVAEARFVASQPWPFPSSLMVGFYARARSSIINVDGVEVVEARWFSRTELGDAITTGEVLPPSGISIARALVEGWYGGALPEPHCPSRLPAIS